MKIQSHILVWHLVSKEIIDVVVDNFGSLLSFHLASHTRVLRTFKCNF